MTAKADEPRMIMKVPISFRNLMYRRAEKNKTSMIDEVKKVLSKETGIAPSKATLPATNSQGGAHES